MKEERKAAREKKFILSLFDSKKTNPVVGGVSEMLTKDLTIRQRRVGVTKTHRPSTLINQYQLYNTYKNTVGSNCLDSTTAGRGRSAIQSSVDNARKILDSVMVCYCFIS